MSAPSRVAVRVIARYTPHARQVAVHTATEPFVWACMGYGTGKTTLAVFEALRLATVTHPGYEGIVAAPTFPLLFQSWVTEWKRWVPATWYRLARDPLFGPYIGLRTDQGESRIWLRSTVDARSVEGINAAWLVYDEASRETREDPIRVLLARVRRGYPGRQRRCLFIGPPMTRSHWTGVMFGAGVDAQHTGDAQSWTDGRRRVVRGRTRDNPYLPAGYEHDLRTRPGASKAWVRQFLDAQMGAVEGAVYETFDRDVHVVPASSLVGRKWREVGAGVDWGWSKLGVFLTVAMDGRGDCYVLAEDAHARKNVDDTPNGWLPIMHKRCVGARVRSVHCDPSRPGDIDATGTKLAGIALVYPADNEVAEGLRRVLARLEWAVERARTAASTGGELVGRGALYVSDECVVTIAEFEGYQYRRDKDGAYTDQPEKRNDHAMDALRYALMGMTDA